MPSDFEPVQSMGCGKPISWECSFITKDNEFARLPFKSFSLRENFVKRTKHDSFIWCEKSERGPFDLDVDKYAILGPFLVRLCCSAGGMNWVSLMLGFFISFFYAGGIGWYFFGEVFSGFVWRSRKRESLEELSLEGVGSGGCNLILWSNSSFNLPSIINIVLQGPKRLQPLAQTPQQTNPTLRRT